MSERAVRCPDTEALADFASGGGSSAVAEHVAECEECSYYLDRLKGFERPGETPHDWPEISARMADRFGAATRPPANKQWWQWVWNPALAYAVVVLMAYPAWVGVRHREPAAPATVRPALQSPRIVRLDGSRSGSADSVVDGDGILTLVFFVPVREGYRYDATILSGSGVVAGPVRLQSADAQGEFILPCPGLGSHPKGLTLRVGEAGGGSDVRTVLNVPIP